MSKKESVENAVSHVSRDRRKFLKGMLIGSAAIAVLPLMKSSALGQDAPPPDDGKGKGKGGKGKGKGKGKGDEGGSAS